MPEPEEPLAMAERHVREGEERLARQAALVGRMAARGLDTTEAAAILERLRTTLELMREHLHTERTKPTARPPLGGLPPRRRPKEGTARSARGDGPEGGLA